MIEHGIEVYIQQSPIGTVDIYIVDQRNGKTHVAEPVQLVFKKLPEGAIDPGPTLRLPRYMGESFLRALAGELDKNNVKTDSDAKLQGTLEATKYHLEDMRQLMKLTKGGK